MKRIKIMGILLLMYFVCNTNVYAASANLSVSSSNVYVGDSFTVTANVSASAAWSIHVNANGPVSGCTINQANATDDAMDTNTSFSATCTATGTGTINVYLSGDVTSASDGIAIGVSGSRSISVQNRPAPAPQTPSNNTNNYNPPASNSNNNQSNVEDTRSTNNKIKELSIEGFKLDKIDDNNYSLTVNNDIESIEIKASPEDDKAKTSGTGKHNLNIGENNIEVVVTSESGTENKIVIKVIRKDGYYIEDIESLLNNNKINEKNIIINSDTVISKEDFELIKKSKKTVNFNYYDKDKKLLYKWIIDGSKINNTNILDTTILLDSDNKKEMLELSNYADGLYIQLKQKDSIPKGTKIKLFVGNKYENNNLINIYQFDKTNHKLFLTNKKIKVENGYVTFNVEEASDILITMSTIVDSTENAITTQESSSIIKIIIAIFILVSIIGISFYFIWKKKSNKDNNNGNLI